MFPAPLARRSLALFLVAILAAALTVGLPTPSAYAAGSSPETATAITELPFVDNEGGTWSDYPAATGTANAKLSAECNSSEPMYRVRWFSYTPAAEASIFVRGRFDEIVGRDQRGHASGVAVLNKDLSVIDCDRAGLLPTAGLVKVGAGVTVYIVQFVRENTTAYDCSVVCYDSRETLAVSQAGSFLANEEWTKAIPLTTVPTSSAVDTTAETAGLTAAINPSTNYCTDTDGFLTHPAWWTMTPTTTAPLVASSSSGGLSYYEATTSGPKLLTVDCTSSGEVKPPVLQAGKTYLLAAGTLHADRYSGPERADEGGPITLTVTSGPSLGKPDLVVTKVVSSPPAPKVGDPVAFRATIKNQGKAPTPGGVVHGVSFQVDGAKKTWSDTFNASLSPGQSVTVTTNGGRAGAATWPATAGAHTVVATVDDVNRMPGEISESNNTRSVPLTVAAGPARPDLVVTRVSWSPTSPAAGAGVTFKARIKNQGTAATPAGVVHGVLFNIDVAPKTWSDTWTGSLAAGASRTVTANWGKAGKASWPATTGQHTVQAVVDDINRITTESDETNNALAVPLNIGTTASRPDLVVTGVSWSPSSAAAGAKVRFTATVKNIGTRSTPDGTVVGVSFRPNGQTGQATHSSTWSTPLHPGQTATLTANGGGTSGTWTAPAGSTPVVVIVDDVNRIRENDEANNALTTTLTTG